MGFQWLRKCREEKKQAIGKRAASMLLKKKKRGKKQEKGKEEKMQPRGASRVQGLLPDPLRPSGQR